MTDFKPLPVDNYEEAITHLRGVAVMLYGGYYEPKSERDYSLASKITKLIADEGASCAKTIK